MQRKFGPVAVLAGVVAQANGKAGSGDGAAECRERFLAQVGEFGRVRVRHIKRNQNLAGIALGQMRQGRNMNDVKDAGASR